MEIDPKNGDVNVFIYYGPDDDVSGLRSIVRPFGVNNPLRGALPAVGSEVLCGAIAFNLVSSALLSWFRPRRGEVLVVDASQGNCSMAVTRIVSNGGDVQVVVIDLNGNQGPPIQLNGNEEDIGLLRAALKAALNWTIGG